MDALQRDTTALLRELHEVEQTITSDAFVYLKQTLNDLKDVPGMDEAFLEQQIERLKGEARRLVEQQQKLAAWKQVLETVEQDDDVKTAMANALGRPPAQDGEDDDDNEGGGNVKVEAPVGEVALPDMKGIMGAKYAALLAQAKPVEESVMWTEFMHRVDPKKHRMPGQPGEEEDEELEVMQTQQDDRLALKCPCTTQIFEDPVKNKNCSHTYSRVGIQQWIKAKSQKRANVPCPVAGCGAVVSMSSLVEDKEKALAVRRFLARQQQQEGQGGGGGGKGGGRGGGSGEGGRGLG